MGQYRFTIEAYYQLGLGLSIDKYSIDIILLCFSISIAITSYAKGVKLFNLTK
jgi:hypothetical protein